MNSEMAYLGEKIIIYPRLLRFFLKPQIWLFYVVVLLATAKKWTKAKNARAGRANFPVIMQICEVLIAVSVVVA